MFINKVPQKLLFEVTHIEVIQLLHILKILSTVDTLKCSCYAFINMETVDKLMALYEVSIPIQNLTSETIDYKIFKENPDIRFCSVNDNLKYAPTGSDKTTAGLQSFMFENPYFWIIPLKSVTDDIFGFVFKSYDKKQYRNAFYSNHISCFYGWKSFKDFKFGMPIILTEGIKDCIVLKRLYPYSLACLTSGLSGVDDYAIITKLTNKIILAYDNDKAGLFSCKRDFEKLSKNNCAVGKVFYNSKDIGELYNNPTGLQILRNSIITIFSNFKK